MCRRDLPDLPEIQEAGYGLSEALAMWCQFQNTPGLSAEEARAFCAKGCAAPIPQLTPALDLQQQSSPNVLQFSRPPAR